jgi:glucosamine--fructose-6-phosphate aminotransferase (isomerizing)
MNKMLAEINEIPLKAIEFLEQSVSYTLPINVPYLGMGSSWFATLAFKYMGIPIYPELASEYYNYLREGKLLSNGVILSQSGQSSEALWCTALFKNYVAITNNVGSELSTARNVSKSVNIFGGDEQYSSSKTYINTLLALFKGFEFDTKKAVELLVKKMPIYAKLGEEMAGKVFELINKEQIHGIYIIGSGPNIATAFEASLILSESTKLCFTGLPMAQYDHGPKETAGSSIVIQILAKGNSYGRAQKLNEIIGASGAHVITVEESEIEENLSVLHNMVPFNYMAYYLAEKLNITKTFVVGGKVTIADKL